MDTTEDAKPDSSESKKKTSESGKPATKIEGVGVPISFTVLVPVNVELPENIREKLIGEQYGMTVVDAESGIEEFQEVVKCFIEDKRVTEAMVRIGAACSKFRSEHPGVRIFYTPYAGVFPEEETD